MLMRDENLSEESRVCREEMQLSTVASHVGSEKPVSCIDVPVTMDKRLDKKTSFLARQLLPTKRSLNILAAGALLASGAIVAKGESYFSETNPTGISAELSQFPDQLPTAVAKQLNNVGTISINATGLMASGEMLDNDWFLSAGHVVKNTDNQFNPVVRQCGTITINSPFAEYAAESISASYIGGDNTKTPDISLMRVAPISVLPGNLDATTAKLYERGIYLHYTNDIKVSNTPTTIGEDVYFVNDEPTANGEDRLPLLAATLFKGTKYRPADKQTKPAIYGGVITGTQSNGDLYVLNGLKAYGAIPDKISRPGASGGAVFNSKGNLVGITIETMQEPRPAKIVSAVTKALGLSKSSGNLPVTIVEPVSTALIEELQTEPELIPFC